LLWILMRGWLSGVRLLLLFLLLLMIFV
jgi:hypothetical protein